MKTLKILTLIFNLFIVIGAGHGIGFLGIVELMTINEIFRGEINFDVTGTYDDRLGAVALLCIVGQSCIISSFFLKNPWSSRVTIIGTSILLLSLYILTKDSSNFNL